MTECQRGQGGYVLTAEQLAELRTILDQQQQAFRLVGPKKLVLIGGTMQGTSNRPSVVLQGFQGGIVYSAETALRLSKILLDAGGAPRAFAACSSLQAQDQGNSWRVASADPDTQSACSIEIRKRDAAVLSFDGRIARELLGAAVTAQSIAAVLAESAGGSDEARRQIPFAITDCGDTWVLRGSRNANRAVEGLGPFHLEVQKRDCAVLDMYFEGVIRAPSEVMDMLHGKT